MKQNTIKSAVSIEGIGVHSGKRCEILIEPAEENRGIIYKIGDSKIVADFENVSATTMCTTISNSNGAKVSVIEHLSAAFYGLGITNAIVTVKQGDEIPLIDGSAQPFITALIKAGIQEQSSERQKIRILDEIKVGDENRWVSLSPANYFIVSVECDYSQKGLKTEPFTCNLSSCDFAKIVAPARTFGFFSDVEYLKKNNLAKGASLENTVVFDPNGQPMNDNGLRFNNEPVRHKALDAIGDLSLAQYEILGRYDGYCPGHELNNLLLRKLFENDINYTII